jgi:uncharacterized membrane protein
MTNALNEKPNAEELPSVSSAGTTIDGRYAPPPADEGGKQWVRTTALVQSDPQDLYNLWRNVEAAPQWQELITDVRSTGDKTSHWVMESGDTSVEWDSEVLADEPGRRIAWRSIGGDLENAGEVFFDEPPGGRGTIVTLLQEFRQSKLASAVATVVSRNPKQAVIESLRHFKAFAETGEIPRIEGQPHGPRGASGKLKASTYGETIETPPNEFDRKSS